MPGGKRRHADTCTSFSTACRAASSGVANSGPTSTSKPSRRRPMAITFCPRRAVLSDLGDQDAWPSAFVVPRTAATSLSTRAIAFGHADLPLVDAGDGLYLGAMTAIDLLQRRSNLANGRLARAAPWQAREVAVPATAARVNAASASSTAFGSRRFLGGRAFRMGNGRTAALSTS